ncbi:MAG: hypothetical protein IPJ16_11940 [Bacteroidales bacterium]|nr:hypothetical protein [Bacteroidales bacterium]
MKKIVLWLVSLMVIGYITSGCSPKAEYERKLKRELASGIRSDSLFMGLYLGMPDKDFYTKCWQLNRKGLIKQGGTNTTVEYQMRNELKYPATMDFYPSFVNSKISEMPVRFVYSGWAPWNKELTSEKLQADVLSWFKQVYGNDFMEVQHPEKGMAYVNISGNRRISIFKEDELHVWAVFTDMLVKKEPSDSSKVVNNPIDNIKELK